MEKVIIFDTTMRDGEQAPKAEMTPEKKVQIAHQMARMKVDIIDKYTFKVSFTEPYGGFPTQWAINGWRGYTEILKPKHFLSKYHIKYTPLADMTAEIKKNEFKEGEWWQLFNLKDTTNWEQCQPSALGFPTLGPWMVESSTQTTISYVRNAYYFKVDTAGQQLPYIDRIRSDLVSDVKNATMKIIGGEVDHSYEFGTLPELPLYKENQTKGNYNLNFYLMHRTEADLLYNFTHPDPVWRQVVRDIRFRQAINKAIKYEDIVETVYFGFAKVPYTVPGKYDPAGANKLLDDMGMNKKDAQGFRLGPDGKRFDIPIELQAHFDTLPKTAEIVAENLKAVGLWTTVKVNDNALQSQREQANEVKVYVLWPLRNDVWWAVWISPWAPSRLWAQWFETGGKQGEEPPAAMKEVYDNLWYGITAEDIQYLVMTSKNMANVATKGFGIAAQFAGEQYFFKN